jgi:hypothetical protein
MSKSDENEGLLQLFGIEENHTKLNINFSNESSEEIKTSTITQNSLKSDCEIKILLSSKERIS